MLGAGKARIDRLDSLQRRTGKRFSKFGMGVHGVKRHMVVPEHVSEKQATWHGEEVVEREGRGDKAG